jgi:hypothetical protein
MENYTVTYINCDSPDACTVYNLIIIQKDLDIYEYLTNKYLDYLKGVEHQTTDKEFGKIYRRLDQIKKYQKLKSIPSYETVNKWLKDDYNDDECDYIRIEKIKPHFVTTKKEGNGVKSTGSKNGYEAALTSATSEDESPREKFHMKKCLIVTTDESEDEKPMNAKSKSQDPIKKEKNNNKVDNQITSKQSTKTSTETSTRPSIKANTKIPAKKAASPESSSSESEEEKPVKKSSVNAKKPISKNEERKR